MPRTLRLKVVGMQGPPIVVIPGELEYFSDLPERFREAGCEVRQPRMPLDRAEVAALVRQADVFLASVFLGIDRELLESAPRLRGVVSLIIGVDTIDVRACTDLGLMVANGAVPENPVGTAEGAVLLIISLLKGLKVKEQGLRGSGWRAPGLPANLVWRKKVGLIGFGRIARLVAERLQGWDVQVLAHSPHLTPET